MFREVERYAIWIIAVLMIVMSLGRVDAQQKLTGLIVEEAPTDSPAAKAGLKVGDCILTYDEKALSSPAALRAVEENTFGKKEVTLVMRRAEQTLTLAVSPGSLGIRARPELPSAVLQLYEDGKAALQAKKAEEAIGRWNAAAKAAQEAGEQTAAAWLHGRIGETYEGQRQWQAAIEAHTTAWEILKQGGDAAARSRTFVALGHAVRSRNDLAAAEKWIEQARKVDQAAGNEMWVADDLNRLGSVARARGDLQAAQDYYSSALAIEERLTPNSLKVATTLNNLGATAGMRSDLNASQDYLRRALAIREHLIPNSIEVASTLSNLGIAANISGDPNAAQDYHSRALAIKERLAPNSLDLASSLHNMGIFASDSGDLQAAQDYYNRALAINERLAPNSLNVASTLNGLGIVAGIRGDLVASQDYFVRALAIRERLTTNSSDVASTLNNLGNVSRIRGDLQAAQSYYSRALAIKERLAITSLDAACSLYNLGLIASDRGALQTAQDYYSRALAIRERLAPNSLDVSMSLNGLGNIFRDRGALQVAKDHYNRALAIRARLAPNSLDVAISLTAIGKIAFTERRFSDARSLFTNAVAIVEAQRSSIRSTEARSLFLGQHRDKYLGLLKTHIALNDLPAAFATLERARARGLVDMLAERRLDFRGDAPADLLKQQEQLDQDRSMAYAALAKLNPEKYGKRIAELQDQLTKYSILQRELEAAFRRASPRFANLQYPEPLDLPAAQAALDEGTLLLAYYVDEKQTYLFAVTKTSLDLFTLPVADAELKKQVADFYKAVAVLPRGKPLSLSSQPGQKLYGALVSPAQALVNRSKRILICPDGPLHTLPFAALVSRSKPRLRYFIEERPLHTIVSMTVYDETRKENGLEGEKATKLLALGDAIYTKEQAGSLSQRGELKIEETPEPEVDSEVSEARRRDLRFLVPLPGSRREVEEIARLFGKAATIKLDQAATETIIRKESGNHSILHLAVHGWLDDRLGLNSGLALSRPELIGKAPTRDDNGLLQAWEILEQVRLQADLVVLSACETGLGEELRGEGLIGLTRAFQYAGAKSVVASLWGAADESTTVFMSAFYRALRKGTSKDQALQQAMAAVRRAPQWRHPFYWSPFVLVGSWR